MKIYKCAVCGQIVEIVKDTGAPLVCCGREMEEMIPGNTDASQEKHVPVVVIDGCKVKVTIGSSLHPMTKEHAIEWIVLETSCGSQRKKLSPGDVPETCFRICHGERVKAAYAFCNLHGLWKVVVQ